MSYLQMLVSIILPVYNVEKFLRQCMDSLLAQDIPYEEYEIICVDDGSTDNSGEILEEYANRADNIVVIHQENGGLSAARNTGIKNASGQYFWFVDSDDYIKENILAHIKNVLLESDCDSLSVLPYRFIDGEQFDQNDITPDMMAIAWKNTLWTKVLKARHIIDNGLLFQTEFRYIEDAPFMIQLKPFLKNTIVLNEIGYFYRDRAGSLMKQKTESKVENRIRVAVFCKDIINGRIIGDKQAAKYYLYICVANAMGNISKYSKQDRIVFLQEVKDSRILPLRLSFKYTPKTVQRGEPIKKKITHRLNDFSYKKPIFYLLVILHRHLFN